MADTNTLDALLKDDYGPALWSQLNDETPMVDMFEREDNASWEGRQHLEAILVNRNRGAYATAEGGAIPTAGRQQVENYRIPMRYIHGAIQVTAQLMKATKSNKGAFVRGMRLEMDRLLDDLRVLRNFYMWGDGRGIRALVNGGSPSGTSIAVDAPGGVAGSTNGARYINVGDELAVINPATGTLRETTTNTVTAINSTGSTLTLDGDNTWSSISDNDFLVKAYGNDATLALEDTEWNHPPMGMLGMVDDGTNVNTYFGLSRTTFPLLQSLVISNVGALSADIIQRAIDVSAQMGRGIIKYHVMHPSTRRAYASLMENDRRYTGEKLLKPDLGLITAKDGQGGLDFGGTGIEVDHWAPYATWFGLDNRSSVRYVMSDGEWVDEDGAVLSRSTTAVDTFDAIYRIYENFACLQPNQSFRLDNISSNIVVVHTR